MRFPIGGRFRYSPKGSAPLLLAFVVVGLVYLYTDTAGTNLVFSRLPAQVGSQLAQVNAAADNNKSCTAGNYNCKYGSQPPQGQKGPCMYAKDCSFTKIAGSKVTAICVAQNNCKELSYKDEKPKQKATPEQAAAELRELQEDQDRLEEQRGQYETCTNSGCQVTDPARYAEADTALKENTTAMRENIDMQLYQLAQQGMEASDNGQLTPALERSIADQEQQLLDLKSRLPTAENAATLQPPTGSGSGGAQPSGVKSVEGQSAPASTFGSPKATREGQPAGKDTRPGIGERLSSAWDATTKAVGGTLNELKDGVRDGYVALKNDIAGAIDNIANSVQTTELPEIEVIADAPTVLPDLSEFGQLPEAPPASNDPADTFDRSAWEEAIGNPVIDSDNQNPFGRPFAGAPDTLQSPEQSWLRTVSDNPAVLQYEADKFATLSQGSEYFQDRIEQQQMIAGSDEATPEQRVAAESEVERLTPLRDRAEEIEQVRAHVQREQERFTEEVRKVVDAQETAQMLVQHQRQLADEMGLQLRAKSDGTGQEWYSPQGNQPTNAQIAEWNSVNGAIGRAVEDFEELKANFDNNVQPQFAQTVADYNAFTAPEQGLGAQLRQVLGSDTRGFADTSPELAVQRGDYQMARDLAQNFVGNEPRTLADIEARIAADRALESATRNYFDAALARVTDPATGLPTNPEAAYRIDNETVGKDLARAATLMDTANQQAAISQAEALRGAVANSAQERYDALINEQRSIIDDPNSDLNEQAVAREVIRRIERNGLNDYAVQNSIQADVRAQEKTINAATQAIQRNDNILNAIENNQGYSDLIARRALATDPISTETGAANRLLLDQASTWAEQRNTLLSAQEARTGLENTIALRRADLDNPSLSAREVAAAARDVALLESSMLRVDAAVRDAELKMTIANEKILEYADPALRSPGSDAQKNVDALLGRPAPGRIGQALQIMANSHIPMYSTAANALLGLGSVSRAVGDAVGAFGAEALPNVPHMLNPYNMVAAPFQAIAYYLAPNANDWYQFNNLTNTESGFVNFGNAVTIAAAVDPFTGMQLTRGFQAFRGAFDAVTPPFTPGGILATDAARFEGGSALTPRALGDASVPGANALEFRTAPNPLADSTTLQRAVQGGFEAVSARVPTAITDAAASGRAQLEGLFRQGVPEIPPAANTNVPLRAVGADVLSPPPNLSSVNPALREWAGTRTSSLPATYAEAFRTSPLGREFVGRAQVGLDDGSTIFVNRTAAGDIQTFRSGGSLEPMTTEQLSRSFTRLDDSFTAAERNYQQALADTNQSLAARYQAEMDTYNAASRHLATERARLDAENRAAAARQSQSEQTTPCPVGLRGMNLAQAPCGTSRAPEDNRRPPTTETISPRMAGESQPTSRLAPTDAEMTSAQSRYSNAVRDYNASTNLREAQAGLREIRAAEANLDTLVAERRLAEVTGRADNFATNATQVEANATRIRGDIAENLGNKFAAQEPLGRAISNAIIRPVDGMLPPGGFGRAMTEIAASPFRYTGDLLSGRLSPMQAVRGAAEGALRTAVLTQNLFAADMSSVAARTFLNNARVNITEMASVGVRIAQDISPALRFGSALDATGARVPTTAPSPSVANLIPRFPITNPIQGLVQPLLSGQFWNMLSNLNLISSPIAAPAVETNVPIADQFTASQQADQLVNSIRSERPEVSDLDIAAELQARGLDNTQAFAGARDNVARELAGRPDSPVTLTSSELQQVDRVITERIAELRGLGGSSGSQPTAPANANANAVQTAPIRSMLDAIDRLLSGFISPAGASSICAGNNCGGHKYQGVAMNDIRKMLEANGLSMGQKVGRGGEVYATYPSLGAWLAADVMKRTAYITERGLNTLVSQDRIWAVPDRDHPTLNRNKRLNALTRAGLTDADIDAVLSPNNIDQIMRVSTAVACAEYSLCDGSFITSADRAQAVRLLQSAGHTVNGTAGPVIATPSTPLPKFQTKSKQLQPRPTISAIGVMLGRMLPIGPDGTPGRLTFPAGVAAATQPVAQGIAQPVRETSEIARLRAQLGTDRAELERLTNQVNAAEAPTSALNALRGQVAAREAEIRELETRLASAPAVAAVDTAVAEVARQLQNANAYKSPRGYPFLQEAMRVIADDITPAAKAAAQHPDTPDATRTQLNTAIGSLTSARAELQGLLAVYETSWLGWQARRQIQNRWDALTSQLQNGASTIATQTRAAVTDLPQRIEALRNDAQELTSSAQTAEEVLNAAKKQRDAKAKAVKAAEVKIAELERNARALQSQIDANQTKINDLRTEAGNLQLPSSDPNITTLGTSIKSMPSTYAAMEAASKAVAVNPSRATGKASLNATRAYVNAVQQAAGNPLVSLADRQSIEGLARRILGIESAMQKDIAKLIPNEDWLTEQANVLSGGEAAGYKGGLVGDLRKMADDKLPAALAAAERGAAAAAQQTAAKRAEIDATSRRLEGEIATLRDQLQAIAGAPASATPAQTVVSPATQIPTNAPTPLDTLRASLPSTISGRIASVQPSTQFQNRFQLLDSRGALVAELVPISNGAPATESQARDMAQKLSTAIPDEGVILPFRIPNPDFIGTANDTAGSMIVVWPSEAVRAVDARVRELGYAGLPIVQTRHLGPQRPTNPESGVSGVNAYAVGARDIVKQGAQTLLNAADRINATEYVLKPGTDYSGLMGSIRDADARNSTSLLRLNDGPQFQNQNYITGDLLQILLLRDFMLGQQGYRNTLLATTESNHIPSQQLNEQHKRGWDADVAIAPNNFANDPKWYRDPGTVRGYAAARDAEFAAYLKAANILGFNGTMRGGMYSTPSLHIGAVPRGGVMESGRRWDQGSTNNPFGRVGYTPNSYFIQGIFDSGNLTGMTWDKFSEIRDASLYQPAAGGATKYVLFDAGRSAGAPFVAAGPPARAQTLMPVPTAQATPTPYAQLTGDALVAADRAIEPEFIQRAGQLGVPVTSQYDASMRFYQQRQPYEKSVAPMTHGASHHTGPGTFSGILAGTQRAQERPVFGVAVFGYHLLVENCPVAPCKTVLAAPLSQRTNHVSARPRNENTGQLLRLPTAGDNYSWNSLGISVVAASENAVTKGAADTVALLFRAYGEVTGQPNFTQSVLPHSMINPKGPSEGQKAYLATRTTTPDASYVPRWAQSAPVAAQTVVSPTTVAPTDTASAQATPVALRTVSVAGNTMHVGVHGDPTKARVVWYNHGNGETSLPTVQKAFDQLRGANVIFLAPQYGPVVHSSIWGNLQSGSGFKDVLRQVAPHIARATGNADLAASIPDMEVLITGFSGGGSPLRNALTGSGIGDQTRNVLCLDCLYSDNSLGPIVTWLGSNTANRLTVVYGPSTATRSEALRTLLRDWNLLDRASITAETSVAHRDLVTGALSGNPLARVLGSSPATQSAQPARVDARTAAARAEMQRIHTEGFAFVIDGKVISATDAAKLSEVDRVTKMRVFRPAAAGANTDGAITLGDRQFVDSGNLNEFLQRTAGDVRQAVVRQLALDALKTNPTIVAAAAGGMISVESGGARTVSPDIFDASLKEATPSTVTGQRTLATYNPIAHLSPSEVNPKPIGTGPFTPATFEQLQILAQGLIEEMGGPTKLKQIYTYARDGLVRDRNGNVLKDFNMRPLDSGSAADPKRIAQGFDKVPGTLILLNEMIRRSTGHTYGFTSGSRPAHIGSARHHAIAALDAQGNIVGVRAATGGDSTQNLIGHALDYHVPGGADARNVFTVAGNGARRAVNAVIEQQTGVKNAIPLSIGALYSGTPNMVHTDVAPSNLVGGIRTYDWGGPRNAALTNTLSIIGRSGYVSEQQYRDTLTRANLGLPQGLEPIAKQTFVLKKDGVVVAEVRLSPNAIGSDGKIRLATLNGKLVLDKDGNPFPIGGGDGGGSGAGSGGGTGGGTPPAGGTGSGAATPPLEQQVFATDAAGNKKLIGVLVGASALGLGGGGVYFIATNEQGEPTKPPEKVAEENDPKLDPGKVECQAKEEGGELGIECTLTPPQPRTGQPRPPRTRTSRDSPYERRTASQPRATPVGRATPAGRPTGGGAPMQPAQPPSTLTRPAAPPAPGNKTPYAPGSCSAGTVCGNNIQYVRDTQCVDQELRRCQFGCKTNPTVSGSVPAIPTACADAPNTAASCTLSASPSTVARGATTTLSWTTTNARSASITPGIGSVPANGTRVVQVSGPTVYSMTVVGSQGAGANASCVTNVRVSEPAVRAAIILVANPKFVRAGERATLGWITTGMRTCVISSPQFPAFTAEHSERTAVFGTATTPVLRARANFILSCMSAGGVSRAATTTVDIRP